MPASELIHDRMANKQGAHISRVGLNSQLAGDVAASGATFPPHYKRMSAPITTEIFARWRASILHQHRGAVRTVLSPVE
jgi:hypothetical protein